MASPPTIGSARRATPGWRRLIDHSYLLGRRWAVREARHRWPGHRAGLQRLLVPLDPWRFYEMGRIAEERFEGEQLDVSSPKLLPSLFQANGEGRWTCIDLHQPELDAWSHVDPSLDLRVQDARDLEFADESFDGCLCVSVIEHVPEDADATAMAEMWRVLRPGGVLHLTTNVGATPTDTFISDERYGVASQTTESGLVFFERRYTAETLDQRLLGLPWEQLEREYVRMRHPIVHSGFAALAPVSYPFGFALRWMCPDNFDPIDDPSELADGEMGVVYLKLRKPDAHG